MLLRTTSSYLAGRVAFGFRYYLDVPVRHFLANVQSGVAPCFGVLSCHSSQRSGEFRGCNLVVLSVTGYFPGFPPEYSSFTQGRAITLANVGVSGRATHYASYNTSTLFFGVRVGNVRRGACVKDL